jgi:hypothetical protein
MNGILFSTEGTSEHVSSVKRTGTNVSFYTNGWVEAWFRGKERSMLVILGTKKAPRSAGGLNFLDMS